MERKDWHLVAFLVCAVVLITCGTVSGNDGPDIRACIDCDNHTPNLTANGGNAPGSGMAVESAGSIGLTSSQTVMAGGGGADDVTALRFRTNTGPDLDFYQPCDGGDNIIGFSINTSTVNVSKVRSAFLTLRVWDVDIPGISDCGPEIDQVSFNGKGIGTLTGADSQWSTCTFIIDPSDLKTGLNDIRIDIDTSGSGCWCTKCDWGELTLFVDDSPPEILELNITPINPTTKHDVIFRAKISDAPAYEITQINWWIFDRETGHLEGSLIGKKFDSITWRPPAGHYKNKEVMCEIKYRSVSGDTIGSKVSLKIFKVFFDKGDWNPGLMPNWKDDDGNGIPNWFEYWKKDKAVPRFDVANYDSATTSYGYCEADGTVYLGPLGATQHYYPDPFRFDTNYGHEEFGGPKVRGVDTAAEVIAHELYHKEVNDKWKPGGQFYCQTDTDRNLTWVNYTDEAGKIEHWQYKDDLPDFYETATSLTDINKVDTWNVAAQKNPVYKFYGDNEYMAMRTGDGARGDRSKDWANPGKQTEGTAAIEHAGLGLFGAAEPLSHTPPGENNVGIFEYNASGFSDYGQDTNGNGLFDYLTIVSNIEVNASDSGYYNLGGILTDTGGQKVAAFSSIYSLTGGTNTILMNFSGLAIFHHGVNGPYNLSLSMTPLSGDPLEPDNNTYLTTAYTYTSFEGAQAYFAGNYADTGSDTNGDGVFENLTFSTDITVTIPGAYTLEAYLQTGNETESVYSSTTGTLGAGTQTVPLQFDGRSIGMSRMNGPYNVTSLSLMDASGNVLQFIYQPADTAAYRFTDFLPSGTLITGPFNEYAADYSGDGLYENLTVQAGVRIGTGGTYLISGTLVDMDGGIISSSVNMTTFATGDQTAVIDFSGADIFRHAVSGQYTVRTIMISQNGSEVLDTMASVLTTRSYDYRNFKGPLVVLTGNYTAYGITTDGDSLYNYLIVNPEVFVTNAGTYDTNARIIDSTGKELCWAKNTTTLAANSRSSILLRFDGWPIYGSMVNGPLYLKDVSVYNEADSTQMDYTRNAYTITGFNYTDFQTCGVINGYVTGPNGTMVSGAAVYITGIDYDTTDQNGFYNLIILSSAAYTLETDPPVGSLLVHNITTVSGVMGSSVSRNISLSYGGAIEGQVLSFDGRAIASADVAVISGPTIKTLKTDLNGTFVLYRLVPGTYTLRATPPWTEPFLYTNTSDPVTVVSAATSRQDIILPPTGNITGNVSTLAGVTVPGASVYVYSGPTSQSTSTNEFGNFSLAGLRPGNYTLRISPPSGLGLILTTSPVIPLRSGETLYIPLQVLTGGVISGYVMNESGDPPVVNVQVEVSSGPGSDWTSTDSNGLYNLIGLPAGNYTVQATPPYNSMFVPNFTTTVIPVRIGETSFFNILLRVGGILTGTVTDFNGTPVQNAYVGVESGPTSRYTYTNSLGTYTLSPLSQGIYSIQANPPSGSTLVPATCSTAVSFHTNTTLDFTLRAGGNISGTVRDTGGNTVQDVQVFVESGPTYRTAYTDTNGRYSFTVLQPGTYTIRSTPRSGSLLVAGRNTTTIGYGEDRTLDIIMPTGAGISGTVMDMYGTPVPDSYVSVDTGPTSTHGYTGSNGRYSFIRLEEGEYTLSATPPYGISLFANTNSTSVMYGENKTLDIILKSPGSLLVSVTDVGGTPVGNAYLGTVTGPSYFSGYTNTSGMIQFTNVPPGTYTFQTSPPYGSTLAGNTTNITVSAGAAASLHVVLKEAASYPVSAFVADSTFSFGPVTVHFSDLSRCLAQLSWSWTFGDGSGSSEQNPVHTYTTPGKYTVSLTVTNETGSNTKTIWDYIRIAPEPLPLADSLDNPALTYTTYGNSSWYGENTTWYYGGSAAQSGPLADSQKTTLESYVQGPVNLSFFWNVSSEPYDYLQFWLDGVKMAQISGGPGAWEQKAYILGLGNHSLRWVYAKDSSDSGGSDCGWVDRIATPVQPVLANFTADNVYGDAPLTVRFTDTSYSTDTLSWSWEFGDGNTSTEQNPVYTYVVTGTHTVSLTVTNASGTNTISKTGLVQVLPSSFPVWWMKSLGGSSTDYGQSIAPTSDGGFIVVGDTSSYNGNVTGKHGSADYWVVKLDGSGNIIWQKCLGGSNSDYGKSIRQTADGGYIVAGYTASSDGDVTGYQGSYDYWIVKLDAAGNLTWQRTLGGTDWDQAFSVQQTADGGYIVAGQTYSTNGNVTNNHVGPDNWVVRLDATGNIIWQKCLGGTSSDFGQSVQQTADGGYIVAGYTNSNNGDVSGRRGSYDYWVVKLDSAGTITWQKCLGGTVSDYGQSIRQTSDGGYIVAGYSYSNNGDVTGNHGSEDYWVVRLDAAGNILWQKALGGSGNDEAYSVWQTADGGYVVAGQTVSNDGDVIGNHGGTDYWVVKLDSAGNLTWQKCLGGSGTDTGRSVQQIADGGYIIAGSSDSRNGQVTGNHGNADFWVVRLGNGPVAIGANFTASPNEGDVPLAVTFSDASTGTPLSWLWDFGDNATSVLQAPSHTYAIPGLYNVTLTANDSFSTDTATKLGYIRVRPNPDFNRNGRIDISDVTKVAFMGAGLVPADRNGDYNYDGLVDISDAAWIAWYYVGKTPLL